MYVLCDECFLSRYLISSFHAFLYDRSGEEMDELMLKPVCYSLGFCLVILKEVVNHQLQLDKMIGGCKVAEGTN